MQLSTEPETLLFLLRHAHSAWPAPGKKDFDRELDASGLSEIAKVGEAVRKYGLSPTKIVSSAANRCAATVSELCKLLGTSGEVAYDRALYDSGVETYLALGDAIKPGEHLLLCGHNPMIEDTFLKLAGDNEDAQLWASGGYPTAGLSVFCHDEAGQWQLKALFAP